MTTWTRQCPVGSVRQRRGSWRSWPAEPTAVERGHPLLETVGCRWCTSVPQGAGHAVKSLNDLLPAANVAAAAEVLSVCARFGVDPETMIGVINSATGRS